MRQHNQVSSLNRRPTVLYLVGAAALFSLLFFYIQSSFFAGYNAQFKKFEPLEYSYVVCETLLLWEQYRNMTTVLTREYLDSRPGGWVDYAPQRIALVCGDAFSSCWGTKKCTNKTLCEENLNVLLPAKPPFHPRQFRTFAVVGNSGDLLKTHFGKEIDIHDKFAKYVGLKRDFRLVVRGAARNTTMPNPVYLFQGIVLRRGAKGTGMKSILLIYMDSLLIQDTLNGGFL
ncbi:unnamed protein product [Sphenostylis stenocarpa]|uniref:Uncharacterized protein n=1 Tax=Sphenostylis stenocarpa TaxID=92480 RepID=A0AA86SN38_9FABA|nr:unnamed protein product [Sphenostylis stenocarpa]